MQFTAGASTKTTHQTIQPRTNHLDSYTQHKPAEANTRNGYCSEKSCRWFTCTQPAACEASSRSNSPVPRTSARPTLELTVRTMRAAGFRRRTRASRVAMSPSWARSALLRRITLANSTCENVHGLFTNGPEKEKACIEANIKQQQRTVVRQCSSKTVWVIGCKGTGAERGVIDRTVLVPGDSHRTVI